MDLVEAMKPHSSQLLMAMHGCIEITRPVVAMMESVVDCWNEELRSAIEVQHARRGTACQFDIPEMEMVHLFVSSSFVPEIRLGWKLHPRNPWSTNPRSTSPTLKWPYGRTDLSDPDDIQQLLPDAEEWEMSIVKTFANRLNVFRVVVERLKRPVELMELIGPDVYSNWGQSRWS